MSEKKIVVPNAMLEAARKESVKWFNYPSPGSSYRDRVEALASKIAEACCQSISENPIVPTKEQCDSIYDASPFNDMEDYQNRLSSQWAFCEWQRRMLLAPDTHYVASDGERDIWEAITESLPIETVNGLASRALEKRSKRQKIAAQQEPEVHPILQEWIDEAKSKGVEPATIVNYIRLFERAFQAGKDSK